MKKLPNAVKWLIIVVVLALMGWMLVKVNDRASRVKMPEPDNSLGIYRKEGIRCNAESVRSGQTIWEVTRVAKWGRL